MLAVSCVFAATAALGTAPAFADDATSSIIAGDFASLKAALEDPKRGGEVVVPGGKYVFTDTVTISKDLVLKNVAGQKVTFELGMFNKDPYSLGKTMMDVTAGTLTFDADSNDNLVFDGVSGLGDFDHRKAIQHNEAMEINTNVSQRGVFLTFEPESVGIINHASFINASNGGTQTGAVYLKATSKLSMNDGLFRHNYVTMEQNIANIPLYQDVNNRFARGASIGINGATFVMNGGTIEDGLAAFDPAGAIGSTGALYNDAMVRAKIEINGGSISNNSAHAFEELLSAGGAIYLGVNSDMVINGGTFSNNYAQGPGGFAHTDWGTTTTINGGNFTNNTSLKAGGAISTYDRFMVYDLENSDNASGKLNAYNISDINQWYKKLKLGNTLKVNGGTFDGNSSYMGGAIYIAGDNSEINAATFTNNKADRFGGAIYLSTAPYRMTIRNAYVANNTADVAVSTELFKRYPDLNPTIFHPGSGGGIWYCPTGSGSVYVSNGLATINNSATTEGADFTSMAKASGKDYKVSVASRMLGGGYVTWQDDLKDNRAAYETPEHENILDTDTDIMLKANASERAIATAKALATTVFENNSAKRGGAIATNGHIDFGDDRLTFTLKVTKEWDKLISEKPEATAELYIVTKDADGNEAEHYVDEVKLNKDNQFTAEFKNLPLENNGKVEYRVKEVGDDYDVSYSVKLPDTDAKEDNSFNTKDLLDNDVVEVTMTNRPMFKASYEFRSETEGKELTPEILALLPEAKDRLKIGTEVTADIPEQTTFEVDDGTWSFVAWDYETQTVVDKDLHFIGTWKFVANKPEEPVTPEEPTKPEEPKTPEAPKTQVKKVEKKTLPKTSDIALGLGGLASVAIAGVALTLVAKKLKS